MTQFNLSYTQLESHWESLFSILSIAAVFTASGTTVQQARIKAVRDTLKNGLDYVNALNLWTALSAEYEPLAQGLALPVAVPASVLNTVQTRVNTIKSVIDDLNALVKPSQLPTKNPAALYSGAVAFQPIGYLDYAMGFVSEAPPSGLTLDNFSATLTQQAADWTTYSQALQKAYPTGEGSAIDAFNRQAAIAAQMSDAVSAFVFSALPPLQNVWCQAVVWPSIAATGALVISGPLSATGQSVNILRYILGAQIAQFDRLLAAFAEQGYQHVRVITAQQNDSLPNIANRLMGNYALWQQIATLNGIPPPYTVTEGQQIFLPPSTNAQGGVPPNYLTNYLGVDLYYGPMDQDMTPWTGDFQTIAGYQNLSFALTRAILTTQGTLIYHPHYGSRVPPEVGAIQTADTAAHIGVFANSTILSDPRVNKITQWEIVMLPGNQIGYNATITPNGAAAASTRLNLVLG